MFGIQNHLYRPIIYVRKDSDGRAIAFTDYAKSNILFDHIYTIKTDNTGLKQVDGGGTFTEGVAAQWGP